MSQFHDAMKIAVYASIDEILRPLIEKWDKQMIDDLNGDRELYLGLKSAKTDVQEVIDKARQRVEAMNESLRN